MSPDSTATEPASENDAEGVFAPFRAGVRHYGFLPRLAEARAATTYFEIGTSRGFSLNTIDCAAVSVDPNYRLEREVVGKKPQLMLFQMTSDDFFARHRLSDLLPAPGTVDLAFLDGMHHFEFLLRDFMNTERYCTPTSVVVLHDCLPLRPHAARRIDKRRRMDMTTRRPVMATGGGWTGDVWKVLRILQDNRPDLKITVLDCPPSSLVVITGCDPANRVLHDRYDALVEHWMDADLKPGWFDALHDHVTLVPSRSYMKPDKLKALIGC
jgi:hypothetical protein